MVVTSESSSQHESKESRFVTCTTLTQICTTSKEFPWQGYDTTSKEFHYLCNTTIKELQLDTSCRQIQQHHDQRILLCCLTRLNQSYTMEIYRFILVCLLLTSTSRDFVKDIQSCVSFFMLSIYTIYVLAYY